MTQEDQTAVSSDTDTQNAAHQTTVKSAIETQNAAQSLSRIIDERLRQASLSFNLAVVSTTTSTTVTTASLVLLLLGNISQGTMTTIGNFALNVVSVICLKLSKDANDRLDRFIPRVAAEVKHIPKN